MNNYLLVPTKEVKYDLITQTGKLIYVPVASKDTFGSIKIGEGLIIEDGVVSFDKDELLNYLPLTGGTMLGPINLGDNQRIEGLNVDGEISNIIGLIDNKTIQVSDDDFDLVLKGNSISVISSEPTQDNHVATKKYVDDNGGKIAVIKVNGIPLTVTDKSVDIIVPTKLSAFENDTNFIISTVNNLVNYYSKSESYNKDEINNLINNVSVFDAKIVNSLPTTNISKTTIYLVLKQDDIYDFRNYYDEYMYIEDEWELIGNTKLDTPDIVSKIEYSSSNVAVNGLKINGVDYRLLPLGIPIDATAIAIGMASAAAHDSIAIGGDAVASDVSSVAIGSRTLTVDDSVAVGDTAIASGSNTTVIGSYAKADADFAIAIGSMSYAHVPQWVVFDDGNGNFDRTISLRDTDKIFFRNERISMDKTSQNEYADGKTLTQLFNELYDTIGDVDALLMELNTGTGV